LKLNLRRISTARGTDSAPNAQLTDHITPGEIASPITCTSLSSTSLSAINLALPPHITPPKKPKKFFKDITGFIRRLRLPEWRRLDAGFQQWPAIRRK
jgi:hypothetical protein